MLSHSKDTDREILLKLDSDRDLLNSCSLNKYFSALCDETFFRNRIAYKYPLSLGNKPKDMRWKQFYLKLVFLIGKMKEVYDFDFSTGEPEKYYEILQDNSKYEQFFIASKLHLMDLLTYLIIRENKVLNNWAYRNLLDWGIFGAGVGGHEDLVNYYLEFNTDINTALAGASEGGNIELVKKLIEKGADDFDNALYNSGVKERRNMVDFLLQHGGNINEVLVGAAGHNASREFIDFLIGRGANIQQAINIAEYDENDKALEYLRKL